MEGIDERVRQRAAFSVRRYRPGVDESVRERDPNLWRRIRMSIRNTTDRYVNSDHPIDAFEIDMHDLWYLVIETAKITPANEATAYRLVNQMLYARELGTLSRLLPPSIGPGNDNQPASQQNSRIESAVTSTSACIWTDLPFLVTDLELAWVNSIGRTSAVELENLAGFTARLAALGVCDPHLAPCVLFLFREALEIPRRLLESDAALAAPSGNNTALSDLLPAILIWLWYSSYRILGLCARNHLPGGDIHGCNALGELAAAASDQKQPGFNMPRWRFWKGRLQEISLNVDCERVAEQCRKCAHIMERWEQITGGRSHERDLARSVYFENRF